jgi:hypothetical protein
MAWTTPETAVAGEVLTAAWLNQNVRDNTNALYDSVKQLGYVERTTSFTTSTTSWASAADAFSSNISFTADGTSAYRFYLYVPGTSTGGAGRAIYSGLNISGTEFGRTVSIYLASAGFESGPLVFDRFLVPSAGAKTVNFRFWHGGGACTLGAGDGTGDNVLPMFMAVYGPVLT